MLISYLTWFSSFLWKSFLCIVYNLYCNSWKWHCSFDKKSNNFNKMLKLPKKFNSSFVLILNCLKFEKNCSKQISVIEVYVICIIPSDALCPCACVHTLFHLLTNRLSCLSVWFSKYVFVILGFSWALYFFTFFKRNDHSK